MVAIKPTLLIVAFTDDAAIMYNNKNAQIFFISEVFTLIETVAIIKKP